MAQTEFLSNLFTGQRRAALLKTGLRQTAVLQIAEIALNELTGVVGLRTAGLPGEFRQARSVSGSSFIESMASSLCLIDRLSGESLAVGFLGAVAE